MSVSANISLSFALILTLLGCSGKTALSTGGSPPPSQSLTAALQVSPTTQTSSGAVVLSWATTGATSVSIDQAIGSVPASGSMSIALTSTTTWTLTARDGAGKTATSSATATVLPAHGATLQVTPTILSAPGNVTLAWATTGATSVSIDHGIGAVAATGTMTEFAQATTTWTLTAMDSGGKVTTATASVSISPPPTGNWQQITLPPALIGGDPNGVKDIFAASDGFLYIGGKGGIYRISQATVVTGGTWQNISAGVPTISAGIYEPAQAFGVTNKGTVLAGLGFSPVSPDVLRIAAFNSGALNWTVAGGTATYGGLKISNISSDATGNTYAVDSYNGNIHKSGDNGATFTTVVPNAYGHFGQTPGAIWVGKVINGQFWWGGEGNLNVSDLAFTSNTTYLTTAAGYGGNVFDIASDGTANTAPTEVLVSRAAPGSVSDIQRLDVAAGTWTAVSGNVAQFWKIVSIANGASAHEYFASGNYSGLSGGVIHSTDGGITWSLYNTGLPNPVMAGATKISVSPVNGSQYLRSIGQIWYHP